MKEATKDWVKTILLILFSIAILMFSQISANFIGSILYAAGFPLYVCNAMTGILYTFICYVLIVILCEKYLKAEAEEYGIPKLRIKLKWAITAILLPLSVASIYLLMPGEYRMGTLQGEEVLTLLGGSIFFTALGAGVAEELVFRGVIMHLLEKKANRTIAIMVPSTLFGFVHIVGGGYDLLSCFYIIIAGTMVGVMFSLVTIEGKSVWNSVILHMLWNLIIIGGILDIGTEASEYAICSYVLESDAFLLTGGQFGIESSLISVVGYAIVSLIAYKSIKNQNPENKLKKNEQTLTA